MEQFCVPGRALHPLHRLLKYGNPYRIQTLRAITFSILHTLFDAAPPWLIGAAVDPTSSI